MTDRVPIRADLRARLENAFRASRWHSFLGSLRGVEEEDARSVPGTYRGFAHQDGSILSIALHTAGDKHVLISHAFGDQSCGWQRMSDLFAELGGDLAAVREIAERGHRLVLDTLDAWPEQRLGEPRPYYSNLTFPAHRVFAIIAEHDHYHAGQIHYIRCVLKGRPACA